MFLIYGGLWLLRSLIWLSDHLFKTDIFDNLPNAVGIAVWCMLGIWALSGIAWLAGSFLSGWTGSEE
jgi:hypothetical protein